MVNVTRSSTLKSSMSGLLKLKSDNEAQPEPSNGQGSGAGCKST